MALSAPQILQIKKLCTCIGDYGIRMGMHIFRFIIFIGLFCTGVVLAKPEPTQDTAAVIEKIKISGNARTESSTVISYLGFNIGDLYSQNKCDEAIKNLYATEFFSAIKIIFNKNTVNVVVTENPIINQIHVEGQSNVNSETLLSEISLKPRAFFSKAKVRRDVNRLLEIYNKRGIFAATVKPKIEKLPQKQSKSSI